MKRTLSESELLALDLVSLPETQEFPAMQFFPDEWLTGAAIIDMTNEQAGAFMNLLAHAWAQKPPCSLPNDDTRLASLSRLRNRWKTSGLLVKKQFVLCGDGRLRNPKQVAVWMGQIEIRQKRRGARLSQQKPEVVVTKSPFCSNKRSVLSSPAIAAAAATAESSSSFGEGCGEDLLQQPDFSAAARLREVCAKVPWRTPPPDTVLLGWQLRYGEALVTACVRERGEKLIGKHYAYLEAILADYEKPQLAVAEAPRATAEETYRDLIRESAGELRTTRRDDPEVQAYLAWLAPDGGRQMRDDALTFDEWKNRRGAA